MTREQIIAKIASLQNDIANPVYEAKIGEQQVRYSTKEELMTALNYYIGELAKMDAQSADSGRNPYSKQAISGRRFM